MVDTMLSPKLEQMPPTKPLGNAARMLKLPGYLPNKLLSYFRAVAWLSTIVSTSADICY
jgi:hypothetical protein